MQLSWLKNIARLFKEYQEITHIRRIEDNFFYIKLDGEGFYFDLSKQKNQIFLAPEILSKKVYQAPFDILLQKLCTHAKLKDCSIDGNNRILIFSCVQNNAYKSFAFFLHFEFTGKHTNAIITDQNHKILEALRHINPSKSSREIKVGQILEPLFQREGHFPDLPYDKNSLFEQLRQNYAQMLEKQLTSKKQTLLGQLTKKSTKLKDLLSTLPEKSTLLETAKKLSDEATLLLANLHKIPPYATEITLQDFCQNPITITIEKPYASPQDLVNARFSQSKKITQKAKGIAIQRQNLEDKIRFLEREIDFITHTNALENLLILKPQKQNKKKEHKFESFFIQNFKISLGKNQAENQELLETARANDIWLHIRDIPSSHMIIHCGKTKVPPHVIKKAGEILVGLDCVGKGNFEVDYTLRKFVKIKERANVVYAKHQTLSYKK